MEKYSPRSAQASTQQALHEAARQAKAIEHKNQYNFHTKEAFTHKLVAGVIPKDDPLHHYHQRRAELHDRAASALHDLVHHRHPSEVTVDALKPATGC